MAYHDEPLLLARTVEAVLLENPTNMPRDNTAVWLLSPQQLEYVKEHLAKPHITTPENSKIEIRSEQDIPAKQRTSYDDSSGYPDRPGLGLRGGGVNKMLTSQGPWWPSLRDVAFSGLPEGLEVSEMVNIVTVAPGGNGGKMCMPMNGPVRSSQDHLQDHSEVVVGSDASRAAGTIRQLADSWERLVALSSSSIRK